MALEPGITLERRYEVTRDLTAEVLAGINDPGGVTLPAVWSTPDMIGKMEIAAAALVAPHLDAGQMTVGSRNEVSHLAATPVGFVVRVQVTLTAVEGRKLTFAVVAHDDKEKVGEGIHLRYVVDTGRFESRLAEKRRG